MPNWAYTDMEIRGSKKDIDGFIKKYDLDMDKPQSFTFDKIIPEPKTIDECPFDCRTKGDGSDYIEIDKDRPWFNWYEWHCKFWGTKWDACDVAMCREGGSRLMICFSTAWDNPMPVLDALKKQNPTLKFMFDMYGE